MFRRVFSLWGLKQSNLTALGYTVALAMYLYFSVAQVKEDSPVFLGGLYFLATNVALVFMGFLHAGFLEPLFCEEYQTDGTGDDSSPLINRQSYWDNVAEGMRTAGWKVTSLYYMYFILNFIGPQIGGFVVTLFGPSWAATGILINIAINAVACVWLIIGSTVMVRKRAQDAGRNLFTAFVPTLKIFCNRTIYLIGFVIIELVLLFIFFLVLATSCNLMVLAVRGAWVLPAGLAVSAPITAYLWAVGVGVSVRMNVIQMVDIDEADAAEDRRVARLQA